MPAAVAAIAKRPYGVSRTTKRVARDSASLTTPSTSSRTCLRSHADQRDAEHHREQHDRRHDVVGQRVERIRRDVEVDEVERLAALDQRRAEERWRSAPGGTSAGSGT